MNDKGWFFPAFLTFLLAIGAFYVFKALLPERLFPEVAVQGDNIAVDSLALLAASGVAISPKVEKEEEKEAFVPGLISFFRKLFMLEKDKNVGVRIAYFGDSMIAGDLIVRYLRKNYQEKYGGEGYSIIRLSSYDKNINNASIRHYSSENWQTYSILKKKNDVALGVCGHVSFANSKSEWARYKRGIFPLVNPTVFYGQSSNENAKVSFTANKKVTGSSILKPTEILNTYQLAEIAADELTVQFDNAQNIPFYGIDMTSSNGVRVDVFAKGATTGVQLLQLDKELVNAFHEKLKYDLVILQFGVNVILNEKLQEYDWYAEAMVDVVKHIRECFPGASVLVISLGDQLKKYGREMRTNHRLHPIIEAQEKYARESGADFINLFELMGGEGAIARWLKEPVELMYPDLIHFKPLGSKRAGDLIFYELEKRYDSFKKQEGLVDE